MAMAEETITGSGTYPTKGAAYRVAHGYPGSWSLEPAHEGPNDIGKPWRITLHPMPPTMETEGR